MPVAVVTGGSRGLGRALAVGLARQGWSLVVDARGGDALASAEKAIRTALAAGADVVAVAGDVSDPAHRADVVASAKRFGGLDLVVNNASVLGPSPQPPLASYPAEELRRVFEVNVVAPVALVQAALPLLRHAAEPRVLNVTSDASVEAYGGWGGYGSSKAALDHASAVLAVEEPGVRVWTVDPGDMRTQMHQEAFPGEDISDRPLPESVVPVLLELIGGRRPSGRYRVADLAPAPVGEAPAGAAS